MRFVLAITSASGVIYGVRLAITLLKHHTLHLIVSEGCFDIIKYELGISDIYAYLSHPNLIVHANSDLSAPVSSGSFKHDGMFVVPCSMKTLSAIACGYASNLITRSADVCIKERRKLLLSPREMPFNPIHLQNMLSLSQIGVIIAPPIPGFYHKPNTLDEQVDFVVGKFLDAFAISHNLYKSWSGYEM